MRLTSKRYTAFLILIFLISMSTEKVKAQFMPVVYDRTYGNDTDYQHIESLSSGEVAMVGNDMGKTTVIWITRDGDARFSRILPKGFISVDAVKYLQGNKLLLIGQSKDHQAKSKTELIKGRAVIIDNTGNIINEVYAGTNGSGLLSGQQLKDGSLILAGYELRNGNDRWGMIAKYDLNGKEIYKYIAESSGPCVAFDVLGSTTEFIQAAFSSEENTAATIARLDSKGKAIYITQLPEDKFKIHNIISSSTEDIYLIGVTPDYSGRIIKIRKEGDIVFDKEIIPASSSSTFEHLSLASNGNILVGGNSDGKCYYSLLRSDGTDLNKYILKGQITEMAMNPSSGESIIVSFDGERSRGTITGLSKDGKPIYQKNTDGRFDKASFRPNGIILVNTKTSRICMLTNMGELLFDRHATDSNSQAFENVNFTSGGDILFKGKNSHLVKMGHGLYVSDVKINKPVNGLTTAVFTVTLTGYSTNEQGRPIPVTVDYYTQEGTATERNNYNPVKGSLSFIPSNEGANAYMMKQDIEVPIKANNLIEGRKLFEMYLNNISNSYAAKSVGTGIIEDHEAFVRLVSTTDGLENEKDVVYELGIFKTNGEKLVNATGADISIDGTYGKGTADALDFDMGVIPRVTIAKGAHTGEFNVRTLEDTRYELPKSVVVDFNKINTTNDVNIGFEASLLSCSGTIIDQPAVLAITSLGDHGRMNNIVSGFFTVSLLRAKDGALLTNTTGGDIFIDCQLNAATTAIEGKDFVLTNLHDLKIWGDGNRGNINLNGIVLFDKATTGSKEVHIDISSVQTPDGAPQIGLITDNNSAFFIIKE